MKKARYYLFALLAVAVPFSVQADLIVEQPNGDTVLDTEYPFGFAVGAASSTLFTVLATTTARRAEWVWRSADYVNGRPYFQIVKYPQNTTGCQVVATTTSAGYNAFNKDFPTGQDCELVPGQQYFIEFGNANQGTIVNESTLGYFDFTGRPFFELYDDTAINSLSTSTRIMPPWNPNAGDIEAQNEVGFFFDFYHNTEPGNIIYEKLGVQIVNNTTNSSYNTASIETNVLASGVVTFNGDFVLPTGDSFSWRGYARTGSTYVYGPWLSFSVVEQNTEASPFTQYPDELTATSTGEFGFVSGIGNAIMQKIPFVWFTQIGSAINSLDAHATTTPELSYNASSTIFGTILGGDTEINLLSQDIFDQYIPDGVHTIFMLLQGIVFYLMGGMYVYRRTLGFFHHTT